MLAVEKRNLAEKCILLAINKNFEQAARLRQQAYSINPPGSVGTDWTNWDAIWAKDSQYVEFMLNENYSDCDNTKQKVESIQAGIFIDYLFDFKDCWGVKRQAELNNEIFSSSVLDHFLQKENWVFLSENREIIYTSTKKKNISAKIYYAAIKKSKTKDIAKPQIFDLGEYDLGFLPGTPPKIIDARRHWLERYDLFSKMSAVGIEKFPKTYQTFEKHALANSEKYQEWMRQYSQLMRK